MVVIFRKRGLPPHLVDPYQAFCDQVQRMEQARDALMSCLPVGRVDPVPVGVGLDLLSDTLDQIREEMSRWKVAEVEQEWTACGSAIQESKSLMATAHQVAQDSTELEHLLAAVDDVDEPLGYAFGQAELRWRALRR
ncbi:MAG: hypothetical protein ACR2HR_17505 [Euzebya sp.]